MRRIAELVTEIQNAEQWGDRFGLDKDLDALKAELDELTST